MNKQHLPGEDNILQTDLTAGADMTPKAGAPTSADTKAETPLAKAGKSTDKKKKSDGKKSDGNAPRKKSSRKGAPKRGIVREESADAPVKETVFDGAALLSLYNKSQAPAAEADAGKAPPPPPKAADSHATPQKADLPVTEEKASTPAKETALPPREEKSAAFVKETDAAAVSADTKAEASSATAERPADKKKNSDGKKVGGKKSSRKDAPRRGVAREEPADASVKETVFDGAALLSLYGGKRAEETADADTAPTAERSAVAASAAEKPVVGTPAAKESVIEEPVVEPSAVETLIIEKPSAEVPAEKSFTEEPAIEVPSVGESTAAETVAAVTEAENTAAAIVPPAAADGGVSDSTIVMPAAKKKNAPAKVPAKNPKIKDPAPQKKPAEKTAKGAPASRPTGKAKAPRAVKNGHKSRVYPLSGELRAESRNGPVSGPFLKSSVTSSGIMAAVVIALIPAFIWGVYLFGARALLQVLSAVLSCFIFEVAFDAAVTGIKHKPLIRALDGARDLSPAVTGLLIGFLLPASAPLWAPVLAAFVAIIIGKKAFGGIGRNLFNPALLGIAVLHLFPKLMQTLTEPFTNLPLSMTAPGDYAPAVSPLLQLKNAMLPTQLTIMDAFIGNMAGAIGEVSALLLLCGAVFLSVRRISSLYAPFAFIGTVAVVTYLFPTGDLDVNFMFYSVLSGSLFLCAFFAAADYATTPVMPSGKLIFGVGAGVICMLIRYFTPLEEGAVFAVLAMNLLTPLINKMTFPKPFGGASAARSVSDGDRAKEAAASQTAAVSQTVIAPIRAPEAKTAAKASLNRPEKTAPEHIGTIVFKAAPAPEKKKSAPKPKTAPAEAAAGEKRDAPRKKKTAAEGEKPRTKASSETGGENPRKKSSSAADGDKSRKKPSSAADGDRPRKTSTAGSGSRAPKRRITEHEAAGSSTFLGIADGTADISGEIKPSPEENGDG